MKLMLRNFLCLALAPLGVLATVAAIKADIQSLNTQVVALGTAVKNYNGDIPGAIDINNRAQGINTSVQKATADTNATPGPISVPDGTEVLELAEVLRDDIVGLVNNLIQKKPVIASVPLGTQAVRADLKQLNATTVAFENSLAPKTPPSLTSRASTVTTAINKAFASAIAEYA